MNPPSAADISEELLLAAQTHFGHATSLWHPANSRYIFGVREGIHIISLDITAAHLRRAARVVSGVAERGGLILFVGTRRGHDQFVVRAAELAGGCHIFERWIPGTLTNGPQILSHSYTKVVDEFDTEMEGFDKQLAERPPLKPDLVVCFNLLENYILLHECGLSGIPTIGIVDTNVNPSWVTYPIPANDDSIRSVATIAGVLGRAGQAGQSARMAAAKIGRITYPPENLQKPAGEEGEVESEEEGAPDGTEIDARQRMGRGSNFYEAGLKPTGEALQPSMVSTSLKTPSDEARASRETKATPGKSPNPIPDRDLQPSVDFDIAANPLGNGPGSAQDSPIPQRRLDQEDRSLGTDSSQVR